MGQIGFYGFKIWCFSRIQDLITPLNEIMIKDTKGSPDGLHVYEYEAGKTYSTPSEISKSLAEVFVKEMKVAEYVSGVVPERKAIILEMKEEPVAPENKMEEPAPENKMEPKPKKKPKRKSKK